MPSPPRREIPPPPPPRRQATQVAFRKAFQQSTLGRVGFHFAKNAAALFSPPRADTLSTSSLSFSQGSSASNTESTTDGTVERYPREDAEEEEEDDEELPKPRRALPRLSAFGTSLSPSDLRDRDYQLWMTKGTNGGLRVTRAWCWNWPVTRKQADEMNDVCKVSTPSLIHIESVTDKILHYIRLATRSSRSILRTSQRGKEPPG